MISSGCSAKRSHSRHKMKYWEIIADHLSASGWTWPCSSQIDSTGRVLFTADAHGDNRERFIVIAGKKLTAFLELESQLSAHGRLQRKNIAVTVIITLLLVFAFNRVSNGRNISEQQTNPNYL